MRVAAGVVAVLLAVVAAAGALLVVAALHGAVLGDKLVGGGLNDGERRNSAIFAVLLAVAAAAMARACVGAARLARGAAPRPLPEPRGRAVRVASALLCVPALVAGLWVALLALLVGGVAAQRPDPDVADGDPCCGHPDTWGEVAAGLVSASAITFVALALVTTAVVLAHAGATGRLPAVVARCPGAARVAAGLGLALAGAVPGSWLLSALAGGDYP